MKQRLSLSMNPYNRFKLEHSILSVPRSPNALSGTAKNPLWDRTSLFSDGKWRAQNETG